MSTSQLTVRCSCGSTKFEMPAKPKASDTITCASCGAKGTYGSVMGQAKKQALASVEKRLKDSLRKAGFK